MNALSTCRLPRIHLASLGCAKNLVDSELILARLAAAGAIVGAAAEEADIIIVNTCGFIGPARSWKTRSNEVFSTRMCACRTNRPER